MIKYKNLYLVGTSHISKNSVKEVEKAIETKKPRIVALELDKERFNLMQNKEKRKISIRDLKKTGFKVFLLNFAGSWLERRLGRQAGTEPGSEMKKAIEISKKLGLNICLIDQDIRNTLKKLLARISRKEKFQFMKDLLFGNKKDYKLDIQNVPSQKTIEKMIKSIKKDYPSFYLTVIKERNIFMARNLFGLMKRYPKDNIVAIIGAGHQKDIVGELKLIEKIYS